MNEEQKEQNIPAHVPLKNNQNIAPTKSWQIAVFATIPLMLLAAFMFLSVLCNCGPFGILYGVVYFGISLIVLLISLIPAFLLRFQKHNKIGAILSILFGLIEFVLVI